MCDQPKRSGEPSLKIGIQVYRVSRSLQDRQSVEGCDKRMQMWGRGFKPHIRQAGNKILPHCQKYNIGWEGYLPSTLTNHHNLTTRASDFADLCTSHRRGTHIERTALPPPAAFVDVQLLGSRPAAEREPQYKCEYDAQFQFTHNT